MQRRARRIVPVFLTAAVHAVLLMGLFGVRPQPHPLAEDAALPVMLLEREQARPSPIPRPGAALAAPAPFAVTITVPDFPFANIPPPDPSPLDPSPLGGYLGCGVGQALTAEERARCDRLRQELFARPGAAPDTDADRARDQRYAREKAVQDHPLLRVCHRRSGPDPLCFRRGYEVLHGAAARDSIPLPLGDPVRPW